MMGNHFILNLNREEGDSNSDSDSNSNRYGKSARYLFERQS